jgi:hypothetical protein
MKWEKCAYLEWGVDLQVLGFLAVLGRATWGINNERLWFNSLSDNGDYFGDWECRNSVYLPHFLL